MLFFTEENCVPELHSSVTSFDQYHPFLFKIAFFAICEFHIKTWMNCSPDRNKAESGKKFSFDIPFLWDYLVGSPANAALTASRVVKIAQTLPYFVPHMRYVDSIRRGNDESPR